MASIRNVIQHAFSDEDNRLLMASSPIFFMHLAALGAFFTGFSWVAVAALLLTYSVRWAANHRHHHQHSDQEAATVAVREH